jgi:hypothetical protein
MISKRSNTASAKGRDALCVPVQKGSAVSDPQQVIARIVELSQAVGWQAGVGAMETAGSIVSYLHKHPDDLPKLMDGTLSVFDWPVGWHEHGCLSWQGMNGKVFHPEFARRQRLIRRMEKRT